VNHNDVDERIREALGAAADAITERDLRPEQPPTSTTADGARHRARWVAPLLAAAAVVAVVVGTAAVVSTHDASHKVEPGRTVVPTPLPSKSSPLPSAASSPAASEPPNSATKSPPPATGGSAFCELPVPGCDNGAVNYEPLWPFANYPAAKAWQAASAHTGAQPWHLDAGQTALLFTRNYLGFSDITKVTSTKIDGQGAHIGVGYVSPNGASRTAAVLHLVRYSATSATDTQAGWEVVGSDDTDFSLETPTYRSQVTSPMTVGGHITGVDENITVVVLPQPQDSSGGAGAGLPAGGQHSPWQLSVPFTQRGVLTIVASTGGHLIEHERFAIQGVHT
jgi:hypothetical protein